MTDAYGIFICTWKLLPHHNQLSTKSQQPIVCQLATFWLNNLRISTKREKENKAHLSWGGVGDDLLLVMGVGSSCVDSLLLLVGSLQWCPDFAAVVSRSDFVELKINNVWKQRNLREKQENSELIPSHCQPYRK